MSSRILTPEEAAEVTPIQWKQTAGGTTGSLAPSAGVRPQSRANSAAETEALRAKVRELEAEAAARESQARKQGVEQGRAETEKRLSAPLQQAATHLAGQIAELARMKPGLRREAEEDMVQLAIAIARRILRRELTADPSALLGIAKAALDRVDAREVLRVRIHPHDTDLIRQALDSRGAPPRIEVQPDQGLERGGIVIETARGNLDASVDSQLAEIERGFTDLVRRGRPGGSEGPQWG